MLTVVCAVVSLDPVRPDWLTAVLEGAKQATLLDAGVDDVAKAFRGEVDTRLFSTLLCIMRTHAVL